MHIQTISFFGIRLPNMVQTALSDRVLDRPHYTVDSGNPCGWREVQSGLWQSSWDVT